MTFYKIYVGLTDRNGIHTYNPEKVIEITKQYLKSASLYMVRGLWKGKEENTIIIETTADEEAYELARELKLALNQESVMITEEERTVSFI